MKGSEWIYFFAINLQIYCCDTTAQIFKGHMLRRSSLWWLRPGLVYQSCKITLSDLKFIYCLLSIYMYDMYSCTYLSVCTCTWWMWFALISVSFFQHGSTNSSSNRQNRLKVYSSQWSDANSSRNSGLISSLDNMSQCGAIFNAS